MSGMRHEKRERVGAYKGTVGRVVRHDHGRLVIFLAVPHETTVTIACRDNEKDASIRRGTTRSGNQQRECYALTFPPGSMMSLSLLRPMLTVGWILKKSMRLNKVLQGWRNPQR